MSLKIHLLIVSVIIVLLFILTQYVFVQKKENTNVATSVEVSPYTITIERASWGLNCKPNPADKNTTNYVDINKQNKNKENNVLFEVSQICDAKPYCAFPVDVTALGEDPFPTCGYKMLQIEYRCFAVDRLRFAKASEGVLEIDCDRELSK